MSSGDKEPVNREKFIEREKRKIALTQLAALHEYPDHYIESVNDQLPVELTGVLVEGAEDVSESEAPDESVLSDEDRAALDVFRQETADKIRAALLFEHRRQLILRHLHENLPKMYHPDQMDLVMKGSGDFLDMYDLNGDEPFQGLANLHLNPKEVRNLEAFVRGMIHQFTEAFVGKMDDLAATIGEENAAAAQLRRPPEPGMAELMKMREEMEGEFDGAKLPAHEIEEAIERGPSERNSGGDS